MITVKKLKELLNLLPDDAKINAYEGEDVGLDIELSPTKYLWIRARDTDKEDNQDKFSYMFKKIKERKH